MQPQIASRLPINGINWYPELPADPAGIKGSEVQDVVAGGDQFRPVVGGLPPFRGRFLRNASVDSLGHATYRKPMRCLSEPWRSTLLKGWMKFAGPFPPTNVLGKFESYNSKGTYTKAFGI